MENGRHDEPNSMPEEHQRMLSLVEQHLEHPLVNKHFYQVTVIGLTGSRTDGGDIYLPEFREGLYAALIWDNVEGNWGTTGWIPLAHPDADIACPPSGFSLDITCPPSGFLLDYFRGEAPHSSMAAVMYFLYLSRPSTMGGASSAANIVSVDHDVVWSTVDDSSMDSILSNPEQVTILMDTFEPKVTISQAPKSVWDSIRKWWMG